MQYSTSLSVTQSRDHITMAINILKLLKLRFPGRLHPFPKHQSHPSFIVYMSVSSYILRHKYQPQFFWNNCCNQSFHDFMVDLKYSSNCSIFKMLDFNMSSSLNIIWTIHIMYSAGKKNTPNKLSPWCFLHVDITGSLHFGFHAASAVLSQLGRWPITETLTAINTPL